MFQKLWGIIGPVYIQSCLESSGSIYQPVVSPGAKTGAPKTEITLSARKGRVLVLTAHSHQHVDFLWGNYLFPAGYRIDRIVNGGDLSSPSQRRQGPQVRPAGLYFPGL